MGEGTEEAWAWRPYPPRGACNGMAGEVGSAVTPLLRSETEEQGGGETGVSGATGLAGVG